MMIIIRIMMIIIRIMILMMIIQNVKLNESSIIIYIS